MHNNNDKNVNNSEFSVLNKHLASLIICTKIFRDGQIFILLGISFEDMG